jgi:predicted dehydrogenase/nucleoside-diphosphate-sugar epimerase
MANIALIGAGFISSLHAESINLLKNNRLVGIYDLSFKAAKGIAKQFKIPKTYETLDQLLADPEVDFVHLLVPPDKHFELAKKVIASGKNIFVEKPVVSSVAELKALEKIVSENDSYVGVNHNALFYPSFQKFYQIIKQKKFGKLRSLTSTFNMPLRQIQARQFGHWMFQEPVNILLEQAVHPLSQMQSVLGEMKLQHSQAGQKFAITENKDFIAEYISVFQSSQDIPAYFYFAVGASYPIWRLEAICEDGLVVCDVVNDAVYTHSHFPWLEQGDKFMQSVSAARQYVYQGFKNIAAYGLSQLGIVKKSDPFFVSMSSSIAAFYGEKLAPYDHFLSDLDFAGRLVNICDAIVPSTLKNTKVSAKKVKKLEPSHFDVLLIGGTGFIGRSVTQKLLDKKYKICVLARNTQNLPALFDHKNITLVSCSFANEKKVEPLVKKSDYVINLAHGGGGDSWEAVYKSMVEPCLKIAALCKKHKIKRYLHIGSIASLYLGNKSAVITAETKPDALLDKRADYARAKAYCDAALLSMHEREGLKVTILRPGVVLGPEMILGHSGFGLFNNDVHCIGWDNGKHSLPIIHVDDVADAIVKSLKAPNLDGKALNLVAECSISARDYFEEVSRRLERPIKFWPQNVNKILGVEYLKWCIKRVGGRRVDKPSARDLKSRGLASPFDVSKEKEWLDWTPCESNEQFYDALFAQVKK